MTRLSVVEVNLQLAALFGIQITDRSVIGFNLKVRAMEPPVLTVIHYVNDFSDTVSQRYTLTPIEPSTPNESAA